MRPIRRGERRIYGSEDHSGRALRETQHIGTSIEACVGVAGARKGGVGMGVCAPPGSWKTACAVQKLKGRCGKEEEDKLTTAACLHAIHTQSRILLLDLSRLDRGQRLDWRQTAVLGQGHGNTVQSICKGAHCILFQSGTLHRDASVQQQIIDLADDQCLPLARTLTAASSTANEHAISAAPPP
jgi:hypothetical protein